MRRKLVGNIHYLTKLHSLKKVGSYVTDGVGGVKVWQPWTKVSNQLIRVYMVDQLVRSRDLLKKSTRKFTVRLPNHTSKSAVVRNPQ